MSKSSTILGTFSVQRLAIDAVLIAMYFGLSLLSVEIGGIKITFASLPTIICAMLFGPIDGFLVGFLGAFLEQMLKFGFTATTLLWVLPPAIRGLFIGICALLLRRHMSADTILQNKRPFVYFAVCIISGIIVSSLNTLVFYVDAKMFHYYEYHMIFGVFWIRIASGILSSLLMSAAALPVIAALKRANLVPSKKVSS